MEPVEPIEFKRMHDGTVVHLLDHVREVLLATPDLEVHVGCDSHNRADHTLYTTTVVLRFMRNGAQVIYRKDRSRRINDLWTRLWGEVERSLNVAELLCRTAQIPVTRIDMDLNSDPRHGSHKLHHAAVGHVRALGYEARTKPDMLIATWAANVLCGKRA